MSEDISTELSDVEPRYTYLHVNLYSQIVMLMLMLPDWLLLSKEEGRGSFFYVNGMEENLFMSTAGAP